MNPLEEQILLSLGIIRALSNSQKSPDEQAARVQQLNARRMELLSRTEVGEQNLGNADRARVALIRFLEKLARRKIQQSI